MVGQPQTTHHSLPFRLLLDGPSTYFWGGCEFSHEPANSVYFLPGQCVFFEIEDPCKLIVSGWFFLAHQKEVDPILRASICPDEGPQTIQERYTYFTSPYLAMSQTSRVGWFRKVIPSFPTRFPSLSQSNNSCTKSSK